MTKKKAVALVRVSTDVQIDGSGLDRQDNDIKNWLSVNSDYGLIKTITASGESAYSGKHLEGEFGDFLKAIEEGIEPKPDALLIADVDRLTRLPYFQANELVSRVLKCCGELVICRTNKKFSYKAKTNLSDALGLSMMIQLAYEESEQKSIRIRAARDKRAEDLKARRKRIKVLPFWLSDNGEEYVLNEHAKTVKRMFELYTDGYGALTIKRLLKEEGYKPFTYRGKTSWFQKSLISKLLFENRAVSGTLIINRMYTEEERRQYIAEHGKPTPKFNKDKEIVIEGFYPEAVPKDLVDKVRAKHKENNTGGGKESNSFRNVLRGFARCRCGAAMVLNHETKKVKDYPHPNSRYTYIACSGRGEGKECDNPSKQFYPIVKALLFWLVNREPLFAVDTSLGKEKEALEVGIDKAEEELANLNDSILSYIKNGIPTSTLKKLTDEVSRLETQLETSRARRDEINEILVSAKDMASNNLRYLDMDTPEGRRELNLALKKLIKKVVFDNGVKGVRGFQGSELYTVHLRNGKIKTFKMNHDDYRYEVLLPNGEILEDVRKPRLKALIEEYKANGEKLGYKVSYYSKENLALAYDNMMLEHNNPYEEYEHIEDDFD